MIQTLSSLGQKILKFLGERENTGSSPSLNELVRYFTQYPLSSLLPYQGYDSATGLFYNEGSVGFVLEVAPLIGCSDAMQREISGLFQHTLPEGSNLQFLFWADPYVGDQLDFWKSARDRAPAIFQTLAMKRTDFLKSHVFDSPYHLPIRTFRCIVSYSQAITGEGNANPVTTQSLLGLKDQVTTALKTLGMPVISWNAEHLLNTLSDLFKGSHEVQPSNLKYNPHQTLSSQIPIPGTGYQIEPSGISLNDNETLIRTYSVRREPDLWSLHAMGELIGDPLRDMLQIPCPFFIHYGVHICHQDKTQTRVQTRESWVENQAKSKIGKRIPILVKQARELDFVRHQLSKGERFVQTNLTVALFARPCTMNHADQVLTSLFRSKRWQLEPERYIQLPSFLACLPMMWGGGIPQDLFYLQKLKTTLSTESANLLPLQGEWKGTISPGMLFVGRRGQLFTWYPFDNQEGNYNIAVVGKSGSGKSVFMQELVTSTLGMGGQVFVLDVGRSFERTAKLLGGTYIEFTPRTSLSINPFTSIPSDHEAESEDALSMLKPILSLMAAPRDGTNDLENAFFEEALKHTWKTYGQKGSISDIASFLRAHEYLTAQKLGKKLFPYTKDGIYGRFFEGPSTVDLSNPMVVIELEELKERKDLQEVIVQMMIVQITNKLYLGDRKTPSHVVLDEAWDMLRGQQSGAFIETAARRLRKYRGSLVVGTQSVNDFYATPAAQVAFENSDWMCLLAQKPESIKQLKESKRIHMDPSFEATLTSIKTKHGQYAEILLYGTHGYAVGRLFLDPFSQMLYSTKPEEFAAVQELLSQGMELSEAINHMTEGRAH